MKAQDCWNVIKGLKHTHNTTECGIINLNTTDALNNCNPSSPYQLQCSRQP